MKITMKNKAYDLSSYSFSSDEQVLLDTNIWLYLYPPPISSSNKFAAQYSKAFKALVSAEAQLVLDPMVLSEYLYRYTRIEFNANYKSKYSNFKDFRNSSHFSKFASGVETFAKEILSVCQIHSIPANELDLDQALSAFSAGGEDFNDALLVDICKKRNLKLMTNDGDFQDGGIEVLTTNKKLIKACP